MAGAKENVAFGGRLGSYWYLEMHMVRTSALDAYEREIKPL